MSVTKYVSPEAKKKANVLNATTKYQPLAKLAAQHGFKLGTVVNYTNVTTNDNYKNLVKYHFNSLTAGNEFKAYSLLDQAKSAKSKDCLLYTSGRTSNSKRHVSKLRDFGYEK